MSVHTTPELREGYPTFGLYYNGSNRAGFAFDPTTGAPQILDQDGNVIWEGLEGRAADGVFKVEFSATGAAASSGVFASLANFSGENLLIVGRCINITTQSTGASTLDLGVAANATTTSDTLIDGGSGAAVGVVSAAGTNGAEYRTWSTTQVVTLAEATGDVDGLVATVVLLVTRP